MDHKLALQTKSIDKYLLNDLAQEERLAFEEHMFDCPECAAQVKEDFAMIADLKTVLAEPRPISTPHAVQATGGWREWFRPLVWAPTFATLALVCIVGYQNLVSIPAMLQPQVLETTSFVSTTRGAAVQTAVIKPGVALFSASFEVAVPAAAPAYVCEFQAAGKGTIASIDCGKHPTGEFTLSLLLPAAKFPSGGYTMILRPASVPRTEISRYSFAVRNESQ